MRVTKKIGFPTMPAEEEMPMDDTMPVEDEGAPEDMAPEGEGEDMGIVEMVTSAVEEGLAGVTDPVEAAQILRDLADMIESGGSTEA